MDTTPETIGKYRVQKVLGRGGMGTVYEARDPDIHRTVAVKTMIPDLAETPELRQRFLREARAAGRLQHRNITTVFDLGEDRGRPYIAMEFVDGADLEHFMAGGESLSIERKLDIIRQVCEGLGFAHKAGIVHRDVKPANIRVTPSGEIKIMDFGIAHLQSSKMTKSGLVLGTVHYMAPEQVSGEKVDHRADVFAVGAIAYELVSGHKPFDGESLTAIMYKVMHEEPDRGALPRTAYSPRLEHIILKALARAADDRYQTLDDMHADLVDLVREVGPRMIEPDNAVPGTDDAAVGEIRDDMSKARATGHLQKALTLVHRLRELVPEDAEVVREAAAIEAAIQDKEVEQLCGMALSYATDGETELASKIASRIGKMAPDNQRYLELRSYLEEESSRRDADALAQTSQAQLDAGDLEQARASADEALGLRPKHTLAIRLREAVLKKIRAKKAAAPAKTPVPPPPAAPAGLPSEPAPPPPPPAVSPPPPKASSPTPLAAPAPAVASSASQTPATPSSPSAPTSSTTSRAVAGSSPSPLPLLLPPPAPAPSSAPAPAPTTETREQGTDRPAEVLSPAPESAPGSPLEQLVSEGAPGARPASTTTPPEKAAGPPAGQHDETAATPAAATADKPARSEKRATEVTEVEALTTAALDHFVNNRHKKARQAVEKALALNPKNKKARDLLRILDPLG